VLVLVLVLVLVPVLAFVLAFQDKKNNQKETVERYEQSESVSIRLFPQILIIIY